MRGVNLLILWFLILAVSSRAIIHVHLVPHTHDDVGWLKTVDQYYSGTNNTIYGASTRVIIDSVIQALSANPSRKFTYVEQAFFQRWWREQDEDTKAQTRKLVAAGQLSFANGGWCMHDEGATHYVDMVDQTTLGHRVLMDEFGFIPTVGWQLDPFGHSATQASLLSAEVGFDMLGVGRIDYQDNAIRINESRCEWVWRSSPSLGADAQVFTTMTGEYTRIYGAPAGLDWDISSSSSQAVETNVDLETYDIPSRVQTFVDQAMWQAEHTRGDHILWTMGGDFNYMVAEEYFMNMDRIIQAVNEDGRVQASYSSPADYAAAKIAETLNGSVVWPLDTGNNSDFFPYAIEPSGFLVGYYTSRPALKGYVRTTSAFMTAVRQLQSVSGTTFSGVERLLVLEEALGVAQHHDAVSGTSMQHVAFDYAQRLSRGQAQGEELASQMLAARSPIAEPYAFCRRLNESVCPPTQVSQPGTVTISIWNQLAQARTELIEVPVSFASVSVADDKGRIIPSQVFEAPETVTNYARHTGEAKYTVVFSAELPAVSLSQFVLYLGNSSMQATAPPEVVEEEPLTDTADVVIENELIQMVFSGESGLLISLFNKAANVKIAVEQSFCYYRSNGVGKPSPWSGSYIFRPDVNQTECIPVALSGKSVITNVVRGSLVQEVTQVFSDYITQTVRLGTGQRHAEFTYTVGAIPLRDEQQPPNQTAEQCLGWRATADCNPQGKRIPSQDQDCDFYIAANPQGYGISGYCECYGGRISKYFGCGNGGWTCRESCQYEVGKEIVSRFKTSIANDGRLMTDSNGREMMQRRRNFRPTWNFTQTEPVAGNYFPVPTAVAMADAYAQLTVLTDRSQGAGSIVDGELELMVHRRILHDDALGESEHLNESQWTDSYYSLKPGNNGGRHTGPGLVIRGRHLVSLEPPESAARVWRSLAERAYGVPLLFFGAAPPALAFSALTAALPPNVKLMTFQSLNATSVLLRLAHIFAVGEDPTLSQPVQVDLSSMFDPSGCGFTVVDVYERSLTNNQAKSSLFERRRVLRHLHTLDGAMPHPWRLLPALDFQKDPVVTLGPMEVKTFCVTVEYIK